MVEPQHGLLHVLLSLVGSGDQGLSPGSGRATEMLKGLFELLKNVGFAQEPCLAMNLSLSPGSVDDLVSSPSGTVLLVVWWVTSDNTGF